MIKARVALISVVTLILGGCGGSALVTAGKAAVEKELGQKAQFSNLRITDSTSEHPPLLCGEVNGRRFIYGVTKSGETQTTIEPDSAAAGEIGSIAQNIIGETVTHICAGAKPA